MQGGRVKKLMFCYSDNVEKELKYNQSIFNSLTDSRASPKEQCCSEEMGIQSFEIRWRQSWWRHCHFFCATTTQPKFTPTNHHLLINIHHLSLGHQGLPRLHQSLEKPPASTPQEGFRGHGEGGGGKEVQGSLRSKERSFSNCCLTTCPPWNSWRGGSITIHESQFPVLAKTVPVFPVPVASSKSDWVFSVAGNVVNPKRAKLNPEKVEDLEWESCSPGYTGDMPWWQISWLPNKKIDF